MGPARLKPPVRAPWASLLAASALTLPALAGTDPAAFEYSAGGPAWRALSGQLVHWDGMHAAFNAVGMLLFAPLLEMRGRALLALSLGAAALAVACMLVITLPDGTAYRGASGIVYGLFTVCALDTALHRRRWRWLGMLSLVGLGLLLLAGLLASPDDLRLLRPGIRVADEVHLAGVLGAVSAAAPWWWRVRS